MRQNIQYCSVIYVYAFIPPTHHSFLSLHSSFSLHSTTLSLQFLFYIGWRKSKRKGGSVMRRASIRRGESKFPLLYLPRSLFFSSLFCLSSLLNPPPWLYSTMHVFYCMNLLYDSIVWYSFFAKYVTSILPLEAKLMVIKLRPYSMLKYTLPRIQQCL